MTRGSWVNLKPSLLTYLVLGLGRLKQLRAESATFLRHLSLSPCCLSSSLQHGGSELDLLPGNSGLQNICPKRKPGRSCIVFYEVVSETAQSSLPHFIYCSKSLNKLVCKGQGLDSTIFMQMENNLQIYFRTLTFIMFTELTQRLITNEAK